MSRHRSQRWGAALLGATIAAGLLGGASAQAVAGAQPVPDGTYRFSAKVTFGDMRSCTGALVDQNWVLTAKSCFADGMTPVTAGAPSLPSTVLVGRTNLAGTAGQQRGVASIAPHPNRNLALVRLSAPVTDVPPVALATTAPATAESLTVTGYGRTATEWVPDQLHQGAFTVQDVAADSVGLLGASAGATLCKGDAGGPAFRDNAGTVELVAIVSNSWQKGCLAETETRDGATAVRVDNLGSWVRAQLADVQVFGVALEPPTFVRRLTHHSIDSATGTAWYDGRADEPLPFAPKAMATLNADTILMNDSAGQLFRVDITSMSPLTYTMTSIATGWTHDELAYDGYGSLYGIFSGGTLRRYTLTSAKPTKDDFTTFTTIGSGFALETLTSPGPGRILGTTSTGSLISYKINGVNSWVRSDLSTTGWGGSGQLLSPGGGLYLYFDPSRGLTRYRDANPFDGKGTDITVIGTDSTPGMWTLQQRMSARPWAGVVSVFGTRPDGHLSYTTVDPVTGNRRTIVSAGTLGFTPKAMAVLNSDTLLVTSTDAQLYRVDITGTDPLTFTKVGSLSGGWTHDRLAYDGNGSLYGIANGAALRRYTVTKPKPVYADIINAKAITGNFTLTSLAAPGPGRILGTTSTGKLLTYLIDPTGTWTAAEIGASGWGDTTSLFTPGGGLYHKRLASGQVLTYLDASPFDGNGSDIKPHLAALNSTGWDPILSAVPYDSWPDSTRRW